MSRSFVQERATKLVELDRLARDEADAYVARYRELLEDPDQRDMEMAMVDLAYLQERYAEETGNEALASAYVEELSEFTALSWDEIHAVDLTTRGNMWTEGRALVSVEAERQALIEIVARRALEIGDEMGQINRRAAGRLNIGAKRKMAREGGIKETIGQLARESE